MEFNDKLQAPNLYYYNLTFENPGYRIKTSNIEVCTLQNYKSNIGNCNNFYCMTDIKILYL